MAALLVILVLPAGCGGSNSPGVAGSGANKSNRTSASKTSSSGVIAQGVAYPRCMRSHGVSDFPDPTPGPGGGVGFQFNGGPGSDLNHNNPKFEAADQACRSLLPGREQAPPLSDQKLGRGGEMGEVHALARAPGFPRPQRSGQRSTAAGSTTARRHSKPPAKHASAGTDGADNRSTRARKRTGYVIGLLPRCLDPYSEEASGRSGYSSAAVGIATVLTVTTATPARHLPCKP